MVKTSSHKILIHETGHAAAGIILHENPFKISLSKVNSYTRFQPIHTRINLYTIHLGGIVAEAVWFGYANPWLCRNDYEQISDLLWEETLNVERYLYLYKESKKALERLFIDITPHIEKFIQKIPSLLKTDLLEEEHIQILKTLLMEPPCNTIQNFQKRYLQIFEE